MADFLREHDVEVQFGLDDMKDAERGLDVPRILDERGYI